MSTPGAERSGQVAGSVDLPRDENDASAGSRLPVWPSSYAATESTPGVGSFGLSFVVSVEPSPPSLPADHTHVTPSAMLMCIASFVGSDGSYGAPPIGPYELLMTLIGGQSARA